MIGRGNARRAARRVFGALQDRRLNEQLILCIIDEAGAFVANGKILELTCSFTKIFGALFPPAK